MQANPKSHLVTNFVPATETQNQPRALIGCTREHNQTGVIDRPRLCCSNQREDDTAGLPGQCTGEARSDGVTSQSHRTKQTGALTTGDGMPSFLGGSSTMHTEKTNDVNSPRGLTLLYRTSIAKRLPGLPSAPPLVTTRRLLSSFRAVHRQHRRRRNTAWPRSNPRRSLLAHQRVAAHG